MGSQSRLPHDLSTAAGQNREMGPPLRLDGYRIPVYNGLSNVRSDMLPGRGGYATARPS